MGCSFSKTQVQDIVFPNRKSSTTNSVISSLPRTTASIQDLSGLDKHPLLDPSSNASYSLVGHLKCKVEPLKGCEIAFYFDIARLRFISYNFLKKAWLVNDLAQATTVNITDLTHEKFDLERDLLTRLECYSLIAIDENKIEIVGPSHFQYLTALNCFSPKPPMATKGLKFPCLAFSGRRLFAISGEQNNGYIPSVEVYDLNRKRWSRIEEMPLAHGKGLSCCFLSEQKLIKVIVVGGYSKKDPLTPSHNISVYDDLNKKWMTFDFIRASLSKVPSLTDAAIYVCDKGLIHIQLAKDKTDHYELNLMKGQLTKVRTNRLSDPSEFEILKLSSPGNKEIGMLLKSKENNTSIMQLSQPRKSLPDYYAAISNYSMSEWTSLVSLQKNHTKIRSMKYSYLLFSLVFLSAVSSSVADTDGCLSYLADMDFMEYVTCYSYPVESHIVVTDDQHELTLFRIQAKNTTIASGKSVLLLWHGLLDCADTWIANEEHIAPAFILANQGYDVWLGNSRGTKYSLGHRLYDQRISEDFWNFSWMEMSELDLPAAFEFVAAMTGKKINYIGHSQGTTQMFAALSNPVGKNEKIKKNLQKFAALGPVAYTGYVESPFFLTLANSPFMIEVVKYFGKYGVFVPGWTSTAAAKMICLRWKWMCENVIQQMADRDTTVDNIERMKIFGAHFPAPTSVRNLLHWRQGILNNGVFRKYDFGEAENLRRYGQKTPPVYDPKLITEEIAMFVGTDDLLADPTDAKAWLTNLTIAKTSYYEYKIGHLTFLLGRELIFMNDLLNFLKN